MTKEERSPKIGQKEFMNDEIEIVGRHFTNFATLIGEKSRAVMLWNLLDGRAYTARELALCADITPQAASNHLSKMIKANILTVVKQGRHHYYNFASENVALAIESIAGLVSVSRQSEPVLKNTPTHLRLARTCYNHLAGRLGVELSEALVKKGVLLFYRNNYQLTNEGHKWFNSFGIDTMALKKQKRRFLFACLDWSERKFHLGGALAASFFDYMVAENWLRRIDDSREVLLTSKGEEAFLKHFDIVV